MASFVGSNTISFEDIAFASTLLDPDWIFSWSWTRIYAPAFRICIFGELVVSVGWSLWRGTKTNVELYLTSIVLLDMLRRWM